MSRLILFIIVSFLSGCISSNQVKEGQEIASNKGLLLTSISSNSNYDVWYYYNKKGSTKSSRLESHQGSIMSVVDFEDKSVQGSLNLHQLEPGDYMLTGWRIYISTGTANYYYIAPPHKELSPIPFTIKAGEITYLGNLHVDTIFNENMFGILFAASGKASSSNRYERDIVILKSKYPEISELPISVQFSDISVWDGIQPKACGRC